MFIFRPFIEKLLPASFPNLDYHLIFTQGKGENKEGMLLLKGSNF